MSRVWVGAAAARLTQSIIGYGPGLVSCCQQDDGEVPGLANSSGENFGHLARATLTLAQNHSNGTV